VAFIATLHHTCFFSTPAGDNALSIRLDQRFDLAAEIRVASAFPIEELSEVRAIQLDGGAE